MGLSVYYFGACDFKCSVLGKSSNAMDYHAQVQELRQNFKSGFTKDLKWRRTQLKSLLKMYNENEELFVDAVYNDLKKPRLEAVGEVELLRNDLRGFLSNLEDWATPTSTPKNLMTVMDKTLIYPEPYGVALVMGAWNYPYLLTLGPVASAICAGNCVVIKPSELSEHCSKVMAQLVPQYVDKR